MYDWRDEFQAGATVMFTKKSQNAGKLATILAADHGDGFKIRVRAISGELKMANGTTSSQAVVTDQELVKVVERQQTPPATTPKNVVNIWDGAKRSAEKKGDSAAYNFAEIMQKNQENAQRLAKDRDKANKSVKSSYRLS